MFEKYLIETKKNNVLIHNITNYVTVNDVANILLASGASPIMADDIGEVEDITSICQGLYLNVGTLNKRTIEAMKLSGKKSNELNHPVILDPVGMGASNLRNNTVKELLSTINFTVIRGNVSEIKCLETGVGAARGVDSAEGDDGGEDKIDSVIKVTQDLSNKTNAVVVATGIIDVITYKDNSYLVYNGHKKMSSITGSGCMLSALIAAFVTSNQENYFEATVAAVIAMGIAGEIAFERMTEKDGNASYRTYLIDAIDNLTKEVFKERAKVESR